MTLLDKKRRIVVADRQQKDPTVCQKTQLFNLAHLFLPEVIKKKSLKETINNFFDELYLSAITSILAFRHESRI